MLEGRNGSVHPICDWEQGLRYHLKIFKIRENIGSNAQTSI